MAEATHERCLRGIVHVQQYTIEEELTGKSLQELMGDGVLTITLDPTEGQRYQGIIALQGASLADALSDYFAQSEQLPTRLWLMADGDKAAGLLLQALPLPASANTIKNCAKRNLTAPCNWPTPLAAMNY